ncbi:5-(carboxyamino)imidazole ribonucleotide synthase [Terrarubrum flagellatum]|uniref:5-(carboxyamino)imidazole ribonucleotide synthase n=1 Tax=Terrirubrum flagellatum TaxID=2895980 RepID=UPI0031453830
MLALAAAPLGLKSHIYAPEEDSPAFEVSSARTIAPYEDEAALARFAEEVDAVTYEFENIPAATASFLEVRATLRPGAQALAATQDRLSEKNLARELGIGVAPFAPVDDLASLRAAVAQIRTPCVLKTRRMGYDGKGQAKIMDPADVEDAWEKIGRAPAILEAFVTFSKEVSVVATRSSHGAFAPYPVCENEHRDHILALTRAPARISDALAEEAIGVAEKIAKSLDYVGVFAVELFVAPGDDADRVLFNEIAPRVHNSGHWTIEGARTSQFEQHIRAVAGWPLGDPALVGREATMENLIGDDADRWKTVLAEPGAHLHLYGKAHARPGRKMGHMTRVTLK